MGDRIYNDYDLLKTKKAVADPSGDVFARTKQMRAARPEDRKVHEKLSIAEPFRRIRESRDSESHPKSNAFAWLFDVTGSERIFPRELEKNLQDLMSDFLRDGYLPDVAVLFAAVGDSTSDRVPLQIGQFESGAEQLMNFFQWVYLEGNGGGGGSESYQNGLYFFARHTALDCLEKRGKRGYLAMTADELPYSMVDPEEIKELMGGIGPETSIPTAQIIKEVQKKYVFFVIIPRETDGGRDPRVWGTWRELVGDEYVLGLDRAEQICALTGAITGVCEGKLTPEAAIEKLRRKNVSENYLEIAMRSFRKVYGINKDKKPPAAKPPAGGSGKADKKDNADPKKPLKV